jgi:hypothetical protein
MQFPDEHLIGTYDYRVITESISEAYDLGKQSLAPLVCMYNTLQNTDINVNEYHRKNLESFLRQTYSYIIYKHLDNQQSLFSTVRELNAYMLEKYNYQTLDEFLIDQLIEVPLTYAILSEQVGDIITVIGDSKARMIDINITIQDLLIPINRIGWENL